MNVILATSWLTRAHPTGYQGEKLRGVGRIQEESVNKLHLRISLCMKIFQFTMLSTNERRVYAAMSIRVCTSRLFSFL